MLHKRKQYKEHQQERQEHQEDEKEKEELHEKAQELSYRVVVPESVKKLTADREFKHVVMKNGYTMKIILVERGSCVVFFAECMFFISIHILAPNNSHSLLFWTKIWAFYNGLMVETSVYNQTIKSRKREIKRESMSARVRVRA